MRISVVIPVLNEREGLPSCLEALMHNTRKPDEIIVVDGGSSDGSVAIAQSYGVTVLHNDRRTAAAGRNVGIRYSSGDIIAFTDGDCIVEFSWVAEIEKAFSSGRIDGLRGFIKPAPARNDIEAFWGNLSLNLIMSFGEDGYKVTEKTLNNSIITANCAYKKTVLEKLNGFDEWFGNNAEDVDLCWRALDYGAQLFYVPQVKILARSVTTIEGIRRKSFRNGLSSSKLKKRYGSIFNFDVNIYKLLFRSILRALKNERWAKYDLVELIWHLLGKYYGSIKVKVINI